jgi:hypothetical protein
MICQAGAESEHAFVAELSRSNHADNVPSAFSTSLPKESARIRGLGKFFALGDRPTGSCAHFPRACVFPPLDSCSNPFGKQTW